MWITYKNKNKLSSIRYYFIDHKRRSISFIFEGNSRYTFYSEYIGQYHYDQLIKYATLGMKLDRYIKHQQLEMLQEQVEEEVSFMKLISKNKKYD